MTSTDSGEGDSIQTPKRIQKRLFTRDISSTKRKLFQTVQTVNNDGNSGEDSDLGPLSPLNITDDSCDSSSAGGSDSPRALTHPWDRLRPSGKKQLSESPFSSLRKLTRESRISPNKKIPSGLCQSPLNSPIHSDQENLQPNTPEKRTDLDTAVLEDFVPETPQKDDNEGTPTKGNYSEKRLITPMGSVCKEINLPRMHRRKSLCNFDSSEGSSPERLNNSKKRHANDSLHSSGTKLMKTDENCSIPRARASLFPEEKHESPNLLPVSTKSFYKNSPDLPRPIQSFDWRTSTPKPRKRHSMPTNLRRSSGSARRSRLGEINAGVHHGIKRPKIKRRVSQRDSLKKEKPQADSTPKVAVEAPKPEEHEESAMDTSATEPQPRAPSPVEDSNKQFFKTNRTIRPRHLATVTVSNHVKLKVSDGKITLNQKKTSGPKHQNKKPKLDPIYLDAADLTVDEADASINEKQVAGILKTLEDDWGDDEYDTMEPLPVVQAKSPFKSIVTKSNALLSPASVLSTMTSSMNIKDQNSSAKLENKPSTSAAVSSDSKKLFPLFQKGYTSNIYEENYAEKRTRGVKRPASWQMSVKLNGGNDQYQLDAGQKRFGMIQCQECGVVYQAGEPQDENDHLIFHNSIKSLKFNGWKNERIVYQDAFTASRIIAVEPSDPKHWWKKIEEILDIVDRDLGLSDVTLTGSRDKKVYLYVRDKTILGVLVAEPVKVAHRMIPELIEMNCCSEEATEARVGVNVIWTAMSHRKKGIGRKLLDILRSNYFFGYILTMDDIAFSIPTLSGAIFAQKYTNSKNFKVYS